MGIRTIDANALCEWLMKPTGFPANCEDCCEIDCVECIVEEAIRNAPTLDYVPRQQWISVKDRLPEEDGRYITYRAGKNYGITCEALFCVQPTDYRIPYKRYFYFRNSMGYQSVCTDVTHWMPLPEPPKEDER